MAGSTTEVVMFVDSITTAVFMTPVAGQGVADYGSPITRLRVTVAVGDPTTIGFVVNQRYRVVIEKL